MEAFKKCYSRESFSKIVVNSDKYLNELDEIISDIKNEFRVTEPHANY